MNGWQQLTACIFSSLCFFAAVSRAAQAYSDAKTALIRAVADQALAARELAAAQEKAVRTYMDTPGRGFFADWPREGGL